MNALVDEIKRRIPELSAEERAEVAEAFLDSIEDETDDPEAEAAFLLELERRRLEVEADPSILIPAEEVHAEIRARRRQ